MAAPEAFGPALDALTGRVARRPGQRAGLGRRTGSPPPGGRRWSGSATPASCPRRARTRPRSPAPAPRTCATGRRWRSSSPGSTLTAPEGGLTEIDVVRRLEEIRAATGELARHLLRDDLRRRAERGDRALPGHRGVEPAGGAGRAAAGRQRRAVPRRDHRHHPHGGGRPGAAGGGAAVHAGAEGADRHVPAALAGGPRRARHRRGGAGGALAGGDGLRPRHRARHRRLSRRARGAAEPVAARARAAAAGDDPVDRARLLPRGRLRHPAARTWRVVRPPEAVDGRRPARCSASRR